MTPLKYIKCWLLAIILLQFVIEHNENYIILEMFLTFQKKYQKFPMVEETHILLNTLKSLRTSKLINLNLSDNVEKKKVALCAFNKFAV